MVDLTLAPRGGQARLGIFVSLVGKMLADDVQTFVLIYLPLLLGFSTAINCVMPQPVSRVRDGI